MLEILGKNTFGSQPRWLEEVKKRRQTVKAVFLSKDYLKGVPKFVGADVWMDLPVRSEPFLESTCESCMRVNVNYDPARKDRVIPGDDFNALLRHRIKE